MKLRGSFMNEEYYEKLLNIKTCGDQNWDKKTTHYHPYEPTLYFALEALAKEYSIDSRDNVVDFGCGKGRCAFFINNIYRCNVIGVEMDEELYAYALENYQSYNERKVKAQGEISFNCQLAQSYRIKKEDNKFYFFNPFSIVIFKKILENIMESVYEYQREVDLILYYPTHEYTYFLENESMFKVVDEIPIKGFYEKDDREKFLIYRYEI